MRAFCLDRELTNSILELSEDGLRAFAELHEDLTNDGQIEDSCDGWLIDWESY